MLVSVQAVDGLHHMLVSMKRKGNEMAKTTLIQMDLMREDAVRFFFFFFFFFLFLFLFLFLFFFLFFFFFFSL
eukprot:COSAG05_NODE_2186_length_3428_cov_2.071493_8_plen_72_part_01